MHGLNIFKHQAVMLLGLTPRQAELAGVSVITPLDSPAAAARWFSLPEFIALLPILAYTAFAYRVFWGKAGDLSYA